MQHDQQPATTIGLRDGDFMRWFAIARHANSSRGVLGLESLASTRRRPPLVASEPWLDSVDT